LNLKWLKTSGEFQFIKGDVRNFSLLEEYFKNNTEIDVVIHLAAQTAVTTSVINPKEDFEINALGTLYLLEAIRQSKNDPIILYASTNKVYGSLENLRIKLNGAKYELIDYPEGISDNFPLDFHSPYGCSKGAADQYVRDYHRIYGMKTVVFRQSCIYGPRQFGVEDQGWVAWFMLSALDDRIITIYGDGQQVRDVLYIDDLIDVFSKAIDEIHLSKGGVYNVGGGHKNQLSLLELVEIMKNMLNLNVRYEFDSWREGDQKVYISDTSRCNTDFSWEPAFSPLEGIKLLHSWCSTL
jgi:CDP-paratose 2-epimerase